MMWLGPVFQAELLTLARRQRFYLGRVLYGLLILIVVSSTYHSMTRWLNAGEEIPIAMSARFGQGIFSAFATLQAIIVLTMTPSLVAGAIADEKQRKTLHYLMASQLTSAEIIISKVAARLLRMAVLGAIGLPVLNLIALFGGVDPLAVLLVYSATAAAAYFLASMAIYCSVVAPKPREAILQAYFFELLWLFVAPITIATMSQWSPFWQQVGEFCRPALEWIAWSSPADYLRGGLFMSSLPRLVERVCWMMGLQVAAGTGFLIIAAWRLRPVFRNLDGPGFWARLLRRRLQPRSRPRLWARPPVRDDAMLWKEMYLHRVSDLRRVVLILSALAVVGSIAYSSWDVFLGAVGEIRQNGYWGNGSNQQTVHEMLRGANAVAIVVAMVGLASLAASSITAEREGDTWTNLTSSPLDGVEVIRGKILGTFWLFRPVVYFLLGCYALGLALGAVHPVGVLISVGELAVFSWFIVSLGVAISLRSKSTTQAMGLTIGSLLFLNVGTLFFFVLIRTESMLICTGCMPFLFTVGLIGTDDYQRHLAGWSLETFVASVLGTLLYGVAALILTINAVASYDRIVDRPDRIRRDQTPETIPKLAPLEV